MRFSERLHEKVKPIWEQKHAHPFVRGLGDGTLNREAFEFYMKQDYVYLVDYTKMFALGAAKARDLDTANWFSKLLHETLHFEMDLHRKYAARFGISNEELESTIRTPTNIAYTHYMLHVAYSGTIEEIAAAVLPCAWGYWEIGARLAETNPKSLEHEFYGDWVKTYSSKEFGDLAQWLIGFIDRAGEGKPERDLAVLEEIFLNTSRFEYMFWDMAYHGHDWPAEIKANGNVTQVR
ncbi:thiaminase II [Ammoniphilus oxalaticus]|uniref:Aminopyrimidine aminohydrolase n=1 Tax=Ammoniphilus oxalaticus TaxID=66863 RepID=A0A419SEP2_9BACL|nr:thiaminase II [Ammoniphilus oxalaticus]RKD21761.1 thiaminase II [Ammoniphilus oxalaticus]